MTAMTASDSAGATLLKALIQEIRQLPKPWEQTPEREQEVVIDRLRRAVDSAVRGVVGTIAAGTFTRIQATVDQVVFKDGVKAVLLLPKGQGGTHELADAQGNNVMVVIASAAEHLEHMERVRADADQPDLFDDQPPAVPEAWQTLLDSLEQGSSEEQQPGEEPPQPKSMGVQCQELLAKVYVYVDLEVCEAWSEQECTCAAYWALEYAKDPENCKVARPHWLPLPQPPVSTIEDAAPGADADGGGDNDQTDTDDGGGQDDDGSDTPAED